MMITQTPSMEHFFQT